jgi:RNA polymerase sigma-70 factor (ECF subfamily)
MHMVHHVLPDAATAEPSLPIHELKPDTSADLLQLSRTALVRIARHVLNDCDAAEDVVHDVYLSVLKRFDGLASVSPGYFKRAVRHAALNRVRRVDIEHRAKKHIDVQDGTDDLDPVEQIDIQGRWAALIDAIDRLPPRAKAVAQMHWLDGLSCATIAGKLGTTHKAVEKRVTFVRRALRESAPSEIGRRTE